jgi:diadenosine tetraphosphate (Ap4A) HIT family hydrolase
MKIDTVQAPLAGASVNHAQRQDGCIFCQVRPDRIVAENELCFAVRDKFPVTPLHTLIIPKRHVADYFDLDELELQAIQSLMREQRAAIMGEDEDVSGFNVGVNAGASAGQVIFHCHIHLIPRRRGDVARPRGGVRGVIPGMGAY